jgi:hypothetical protein
MGSSNWEEEAMSYYRQPKAKKKRRTSNWEEEAMSYYRQPKAKKKRKRMPRISAGPPGYYQQPRPQVIYIQQAPRRTRTRKPKQESQQSLYQILTSKKAKKTYKEAGQVAAEGAKKIGSTLKEKLFKKKSIYD